MAFVQNQHEEEENQTNEQDPQSNENVVSSPTAPITGGGAGGTGAVAGASSGGQKPGRSSFVNLRSYMDANKGETADNMSNKLVTGVSGAADQATQQVADTNTAFTQHADTNTVKADENVLTNILDPNNKQGFQTMYNAAYQGPNAINEVETWNDAAGSYEKAGQRITNLQSFPGTAQELKTEYARPDFGRGMVSLDNYLVRDSAGAGQFKDLTSQYADLQRDPETGNYRGLQSYLQSSMDYANQAKATTQATADRAREVYGTTSAEYQAVVQKAIADAAAATDAANTNYNAMLNPMGGIAGISGFEAETGMTLDQLNKVFNGNFDAKSLFTGPSAYGAGDFLTQEQMTNLAALEGLLDSDKVIADDYTKTGGKGYSTNQDTLSQARDAVKAYDAQQEALAAAAWQQEAAAMQQAPTGGYGSGGEINTSPTQYTAPKFYYSDGRQLTRPGELTSASRVSGATDPATDALIKGLFG
jgi:hypothetical protein